MLIDIHSHTADSANIVIRNVHHNQVVENITDTYTSGGIHPWYVQESTLVRDMDKLDLLAKTDQFIAIGESGLDKSCKTDYALQKLAFELQIDLAKKHDLPMIIHCVKSYSELLFFRKKSAPAHPWILHGYNASKETAFQFIQKDCYLSFGKVLFAKSTNGHKAFTQIPLERIFLETDDTDISITEVYKLAAELRNISIFELKEQIQQNFTNCFEIRL